MNNMEKARAALTAAAQRRAAQRIEDVEELSSWGLPLEDIAQRAGFTSIEAASRYLRRRGRPDLARPFERQAWHRHTSSTQAVAA